MCIGTCAMVFLPALVEKLLRCKIHPMVYGWRTLYGRPHDWRMLSSLLHDNLVGQNYYANSGGILFALVGLYLIQYLNRNKVNSTLSCALFALCFSITISVCWEFVEFGSDRLLGADMRRILFLPRSARNTQRMPRVLSE